MFSGFSSPENLIMHFSVSMHITISFALDIKSFDVEFVSIKQKFTVMAGFSNHSHGFSMHSFDHETNKVVF